MSFQLPAGRPVRLSRPPWSNVAFLVEAMLLLVFVMGSMAVCTQLFGQAVERGLQSERLSQAIAAVTDRAELFAANPQAAQGVAREGGLVVVCAVSDEARPGGTFYHATINAYWEASELDAATGEASLAEEDSLHSAASAADSEEAYERAEGVSEAEGDAFLEDLIEDGQPLFTLHASRYRSEVG